MLIALLPLQLLVASSLHSVRPATNTSLATDTASVREASKPDSTQQRRAVELSDWYERRNTIHRIGSYFMLPLFIGEYALGEKLLNGTNVSSSVKSTHQLVAGGIGVLFVVNTVTGVWNLWEGRAAPGQGKRVVHAMLMLAADVGFAITPSLAEEEGGSDQLRTHRNVALGSMALSTAGAALMWFWK